MRTLPAGVPTSSSGTIPVPIRVLRSLVNPQPSR
jgi:hypothetical protein